jgi:hypothetical protein
VTVLVPAARLEVVKVATPSTSVSLSIAPFLSLKVTVPAFGVAPDKSLTVAVNVTDCPSNAEAVEALSAVRVGRALNRARCSRRPTWGRNRTRNGSLSGRRVRRPRREGALSAPKAPDSRGGTAIGAGAERAPNGLAERESGFDKRLIARSRSGVVMANALQGALLRPLLVAGQCRAGEERDQG